MGDKLILNIKEEVDKVIEQSARAMACMIDEGEKIERTISGPHDNVHHPKHYEIVPGVEAIDVIRAVTGDSFVGYCRGNALKYLIRADHKGGVEDLKKAMVYIDWEIKEREK